jgi:hypothetical protein
MSLGVPREIVIGKKKHRFLNLLAKMNRSTEKYHSLLKRALTIIIGWLLLYLQLTDHTNVPWAVDIIICMQGFPETWKLFQGFLQGKKIEKGCSKVYMFYSSLQCSLKQSVQVFPSASRKFFSLLSFKRKSGGCEITILCVCQSVYHPSDCWTN